MKERQGDFSELLNPSLMCLSTDTTAQCTGKLIQLYDATTPGFPAYPNNKIPIGANSAANYLIANPTLYPLPNQNPQAGSPATNNYRGVQKLRNYGDQFDIKGDWKATEKDNLSVRYTWGHFGQTTINPLPTSFAAAPTFPVWGLAINAVHTFNPLMLNEFRAGYTRIQNNGAVLLDPTGVFGLNGNKILGIGSDCSRLSTAGVCRLLRSGVRQFKQSSGIQCHKRHGIHQPRKCKSRHELHLKHLPLRR